MHKSIILGLVCALVLAGCAAGSGAKDAPAKSVEAYLQAIVTQQGDQVSNLSTAWEESAMMEMDSFMGVTAELKDAVCKVSGTDGASTLVECSGKIVATYKDEQQELDLAGRTYDVQQEGGEWRVCGVR
jgi:uncharacterized protein (DUF849 family)